MNEKSALTIGGASGLSVDSVADQLAKVHELMQRVMLKDSDFGVIPGTKKPTLYKPGAEKLGFLFNYVPTIELTKEELPNGHREYECKVSLTHRGTGDHVGDGVGSASTMEKKHRWRKGQRACPRCGQETIIKGRDDYGGGWVCWKSKGGCGTKFDDHDPDISGQALGNIENPDIADVYNTIKKMAKKRAFVDAILTATGASSLFTQDVEDFADAEPHPPAEPPRSDPEPQRNGNGKSKEEPPSSGRKATQKQITMLKARITAKAKASDFTFDQISQAIMNHFAIDSSVGLLIHQVDEALALIDNIDKEVRSATDDVPF